MLDTVGLPLSTISEDFNFHEMDANALYENLRNTMCRGRGLGLAAIQIGIPFRVFVMGSPEDPDSVIPVFNPILVDAQGESEYMEEGCLSFPGFTVKVKRFKEIRVRMTTLDGETDVAKFTGMTARIFQHELDHLNGVVFTDRATKYHLEKARKDHKNLTRRRKQNLLTVPAI